MNQKCKLPRIENIYNGVVSSLKTTIIYYHKWSLFLEKEQPGDKTGTLNTPQFCICCSTLPFPNIGTSSSAHASGWQLLSAHFPPLRVKVGDGAELGTSLPYHIYSVEARGLRSHLLWMVRTSLDLARFGGWTKNWKWKDKAKYARIHGKLF